MARCLTTQSKSLFNIWSLLYWRRQWHPTPVLLPGKSHGRRSLIGCSPWGRKESNMTEQLHFHFSLSCIGEGNDNPLQCSCLENPRDGGARWAAVYEVARSRTRLKQQQQLAAAATYSIVYVNHMFFIHLSTDGYKSCFHISTIINSTAINMQVHICFLS